MSKFIADYESECEVCENTPTVVIKGEGAEGDHHLGLCGVCTFGTAKALDTAYWENLDAKQTD